MASGMAINKECKKAFDEFRLDTTMGKGLDKKYVAFKVNDDRNEIIIDEMGGTQKGPYSDFEDYIKKVEEEMKVEAPKPKGFKGKEEPRGCRYAVVFVEYLTDSGQPRSKPVFVAYNSEHATIKDKISYTSSKQILKKVLDIETEIQATDLTDVSENSVKEEMKRKFKD
jgi:hypothetical protein